MKADLVGMRGSTVMVRSTIVVMGLRRTELRQQLFQAKRQLLDGTSSGRSQEGQSQILQLLNLEGHLLNGFEKGEGLVTPSQVADNGLNLNNHCRILVRERVQVDSQETDQLQCLQ